MDSLVTLEQATAAATASKMADPDAMARSWVDAKLSTAQAQNIALAFKAERIGDDGARPTSLLWVPTWRCAGVTRRW